jgi:enamine deaminase RidA (YjgF/YER057c/UK114 family)
MEAALQDEGMTFAHVVRTWFYIDAILAWYDDFNAVRNAFFEDRHIFAGVVPASTGVGIANPHGVALVGSLLAVKPLTAAAKVTAVPSPLQCPAPNYRSAFSRAVEVRLAGQRHLYVSGTASIAPGGESQHHGDRDAQIERTMQVVAAILESRGMSWADTTHAVAYFRSLQDEPRFTAWRRAHGLGALPVTAVEATICRDELLFELELEAQKQD